MTAEPEERPLAIFGTGGSMETVRLLNDAGITAITRPTSTSAPGK